MRLATLQSLVCDQVRESSGFFPLRLDVRRFRPVFAAFLRSPSPMTFAMGFILSRASLPLQSSLSLSPAHPPFGFRAPPVGFVPSSRYQSVESTLAGFPSPLRSVLDVSHVLDGFLLRRPCGFISPRNRVQGSLFRDFPSRIAVRAHARRLPSCRFRQLPANDCSRAPGASGRLQGLLPSESPLRPVVV
jgi:hypothetical protein